VITRWLPKDRILKRALYSLIACILLAALAGGLGAYDLSKNGWPEEGRRHVAEAVWQYGAASPQAAAAIQQMSQSANPKALIALIDPTSGKAVAAAPADLVGKKTEEITLPNGAKLPAIDRLASRERVKLRPDQSGGAEITVRVTPLYPWSGEERRGDKRGGGVFGRKDYRNGHDRRAVGRGEARAPQPNAPTPDAILLVAAPEAAVTPVGIAAGVVGALALLAFVVYWLSIAWWVFADARARGGKAFAWGVLTLLTNLVGAAVYLVARREQRNCPGCGAAVERSFNHCPYCGHALRHTCPSCGHQLRAGWTHCAHCGTLYEGPEDNG